ncbi:MAG: hypothetical protein QOG31_655 [Thermoplasmata archaeon]|nr:hypothetical protein [Thermoplasmata archaeon]
MMKTGLVAIGLLTAAALLAIVPTASASCGGDIVPEVCVCFDTRGICPPGSNTSRFQIIIDPGHSIHICVNETLKAC